MKKLGLFLFLFIPFFAYGDWVEERLEKMALREKIG
jgi:hypothetical protein